MRKLVLLAPIMALAIGSLLPLATAPQGASAHGCTLTAGYYKNHLDLAIASDPDFHIPVNGLAPAGYYHATTPSQILNVALHVLVYDPDLDGVKTASDPLAKLARATLVAELNTHNGVDGSTYLIQVQNQALAFLQSHTPGTSVSSGDATTIIAWAKILDAYANGDNVTYGYLGPGHCSS